MFKIKFTVSILLLYLSMLGSTATFAQGTAFTYQGKLTDSGNLANGQFDFQFKLFDTQTVGTGTQQGITVSVPNVPVSNGIFTVSLDFGACPTCFNSSARFLEIAVRPSGGGAFTTLTPRQPITSTPYALKSVNAATADGLSVACVNCVTSSQIASVNGSAVTGTIPVASVPASSSNYIQNTTSQQAASNFNISGTGTANILNATTQYNLGGQRLLSAAGTNNLFAGISAGTTGSNNAFFGANAGQANTTGGSNSFFGFNAGNANTSSNNNSFFGASAGVVNTGFNNAFFGTSAGVANQTGNRNAFYGHAAGNDNLSGSDLTMIGDNASTGATNLTNATAIGAKAQVNQSNSLVLGSIAGINGATTDTNIGIGTTTPAALLDVNGDVRVNGAITIAAQTRHLSISAAGFTPTRNAKHQDAGFGVFLENVFDFSLVPLDMVAAAMVNLPDGAVVTRVRANVLDSDSDAGQNITISLRRKGLNGDTGTPISMATVSSSGTGSNIILTTTSISNATIDNGSFSYYIWANSPNGSTGSWYIFSVIIDYTVTTPLP